jgi:putative oxidoreductase
MLKKVLFGGESGLSFPANAGLTLLRIFAGVALLMSHGMGKIPPSEQFIGTAAGIGFPMAKAFAWAAALSESLGGAFLALGFLTRPAAFFIAFTMGTALLGIHRADPFPKQELAFLYFFIAFAHLIMGAGDWSIDRFLRK